MKKALTRLGLIENNVKKIRKVVINLKYISDPGFCNFIIPPIHCQKLNVYPCNEDKGFNIF
jgi:hypothetical protein